MNLAGEPLRGSLVRAIGEVRPAARVVNLYGPSEDTTYSTVAACCSSAGSAVEPTIGRPISATRAYVVADSLDSLPLGVVGELVLSGGGLSRGYLGRPGLTAERFVPDPFAERAGGRLYRTGDRARYLADGRLEFLGRRDHQVKLRGFRIELGEIESVLSSHGSVRESVALVRGESRLVAWVTPLSGAAGELDLEALRGELSSRLPGFMVPSMLVALEELPRLPNGKLDRDSLLRGVLPSEGSEDAGGSPGTPTEELLAGLWCEVLGLERVVLGEDFFRLGGHSLLATQLASRIRRVFGVEVPLRRLFEASTLAEQAAELETARRESALEMPPLVPVAVTEGGARTARASFAQERLWFLDRLEPGELSLQHAGGGAAAGCVVRRSAGGGPLGAGAPSRDAAHDLR